MSKFEYLYHELLVSINVQDYFTPALLRIWPSMWIHLHALYLFLSLCLGNILVFGQRLVFE